MVDSSLGDIIQTTRDVLNLPYGVVDHASCPEAPNP